MSGRKMSESAALKVLRADQCDLDAQGMGIALKISEGLDLVGLRRLAGKAEAAMTLGNFCRYLRAPVKVIVSPSYEEQRDKTSANHGFALKLDSGEVVDLDGDSDLGDWVLLGDMSNEQMHDELIGLLQHVCWVLQDDYAAIDGKRVEPLSA